MSATLKEFCDLLQKCALKLEAEMMSSIGKYQKNIMSTEISDTKLALEKAKDYHSKEIITILSGIITNIKQIIYHEDKIKQLNDKEKLTEEELTKYSYVKRQVSAFSGGEKVVRRELRRVASENSVYCLETWEKYLNEEDNNQSVMYSYNSLPNINVVPKRESPKTKRKQRKLVSSTFENILEDEEARLRPMDSLPEEAAEDASGKHSYLSRSTPEIHFATRPRIENIQIEKENKDIKVHSTCNDIDNKEINHIVGNVHQPLIESTGKTSVANGNLVDISLDTKPRIVGFVVSSNI